MTACATGSRSGGEVTDAGILEQTIDRSQCLDVTDPPETATAERLIGPTQSSTVMPSATASAM